jgi:predicted O-methyltransferase YrrM
MLAVMVFFFRLLERLGIHLTPNHYHFPIPDTSRLEDAIWTRASELPGVEMNEPEQLVLLDRLSSAYANEWAGLPRTRPQSPNAFHLENGHFETVDAEMYYGLIRERAPRRILEIGSGFSSRLALAALEKNREAGKSGAITLCDPHPPAWAHAGRGAIDRIIPSQVQGISLTEFTSLSANDMLFIDSSHVLAIGSDVQFLFLEALPRLRPGVLVHVHDIFFPEEYPRYWVRDRLRFWNEQYLLQAFLAFNPRFRVLWASHWIAVKYPGRLQQAIPSFVPGKSPGSFWMERV